MYYNRYNIFINDEKIPIIPFIEITDKNTDQIIIWKKNEHRMDRISNQFYGHPYGGWLILLKNGLGDEFDIEDETSITIPYPWRDSLQSYIDAVNRYSKKNLI